MKKIFMLLFIIISLFLLSNNNVNASNYINNFFKVSLTENKVINSEEYITLNLVLDVDYELNSIIGDIIYEKNKIELTKCESEYFTCTYNKKILLDNITGISGNKTIATLTFKVLNEFKPGDDVLVEFKNVRGFNNTIGNNTEVKIHKLQNDNTLKTLSIPNETLIPPFSPDITTYKVITYNKTINIEALSLSKITNDGEKELKYGNNIFEIVVTSETNAEKTYVINVFREKEIVKKEESIDNEKDQQIENKPNDTKNENKETSQNNNSTTKKLSSNKKLLSLKLVDTDFVFNENIFEYSIYLTKEIKKIKINYQLEDKKSKVVISGDTNLAKKDNKIVISVIAEDGSQIDYKINVIKDIDEPITIEKDSNNKNEEMKEEIKTKKSKNIIYYLIIPIVIIFVVLTKIIDKKK